MKLQPTAHWLIPALLAALFVMGGCAAADDESLTGDDITGNCETNADCAGDQMCRDGFCSVRSTSSTEMSFRFVPSSSSEFLPQFAEDVPVRYDQRLTFGLEQGITISSGSGPNNAGEPGGIRFADEPLQGPSGTLILRPYGARDQLFIREVPVDDGDFTARVMPGRYSLTFVPEERSRFPKKTWTDEVFESNTVLVRNLPSSYTRVEGNIIRESVIPGGVGADDQNVTNARVYAISPDGRHASTITQTDDRGRFSLKVEPNTGWYDLYVVPASPDVLLPRKKFERAFEATDNTCVTDDGREADPCLLTKSLGTYASTPVSTTIRLTAPQDFDDSPSWDGTSIKVTGRLGAGEFSRRYSVGPDQTESGVVELELYPTTSSIDLLPTYTIEIIPPTRSPFARTTYLLDGSVDETSLFEVPLKRRVSGEILDTDGRPIDAARLEFHARPDEGDPSSQESVDERMISVTTDPDGRFEVWLEATHYDVLVVPPLSSGRPRMLSQLSPDQLSESGVLTLQAPPPAVLVGDVVGETLEGDELRGVSDMTVEAYRTIGGRTVVFGEARTDASGAFRMVLSSEL